MIGSLPAGSAAFVPAKAMEILAMTYGCSGSVTRACCSEENNAAIAARPDQMRALEPFQRVPE